MKKIGKVLTIFLLAFVVGLLLQQTTAEAFTIRPAYIQWDLHYNQKKDETIIISDWEYNSAEASVDTIKLNKYTNPSQANLLKLTTTKKDDQVYVNIKADVPPNIPAGTYYYAINIKPSTAEDTSATAAIKSSAQIVTVINVIPNNESLEKNLQKRLTTRISVKKPKIPILLPYSVTVTISNKSPFVVSPIAAIKIILQSPFYNYYSKRIDLSDSPLLPNEERTETFKVPIWKLQTLRFSKAVVKAKVYNNSGNAIDTSEYEIKRPLWFLVILTLIFIIIIAYPFVYIAKTYKKKRLLKGLIYTPKLQKIIKK